MRARPGNHSNAGGPKARNRASREYGKGQQAHQSWLTCEGKKVGQEPKPDAHLKKSLHDEMAEMLDQAVQSQPWNPRRDKPGKHESDAGSSPSLRRGGQERVRSRCRATAGFWRSTEAPSCGCWRQCHSGGYAETPEECHATGTGG